MCELSIQAETCDFLSPGNYSHTKKKLKLFKYCLFCLLLYTPSIVILRNVLLTLLGDLYVNTGITS